MNYKFFLSVTAFTLMILVQANAQSTSWVNLQVPGGGKLGVNFIESGFISPGDCQYGGRIYYDEAKDMLKIVTKQNNIENVGLCFRRAYPRVGVGNFTNASDIAAPLTIKGTTNNAQLEMGNHNTYDNYIQSYDRVAAGYKNLTFITKSGGTMTLLTSGNVGIGTTTPSKLFEIYGQHGETVTPAIRLINRGIGSGMGTWFAWDISNIGTTLEFSYGTANNTNLSTAIKYKFNGSGELYAAKFTDINSSGYFLDPSNAGMALKVEGTIETKSDVIINSNDDGALVLDNTGGKAQFIYFYTNGEPNSWNTTYRKAFMGLDFNGSDFVLNNKGKIKLVSGTYFSLTSNNFKVTDTGIVYAREVNVMNGPFPDYVFKPDYKLRSIDEVEKYIIDNKHLPGMPTEDEVTKTGVNISEMNNILIEKIEELTLYMIELKNENEVLKNRMDLLEEK